MFEIRNLEFEKVLKWLLKTSPQEKEEILQNGVSVILPDGDDIIIAKKKTIEKVIKEEIRNAKKPLEFLDYHY